MSNQNKKQVDGLISDLNSNQYSKNKRSKKFNQLLDGKDCSSSNSRDNSFKDDGDEEVDK